MEKLFVPEGDFRKEVGWALKQTSKGGGISRPKRRQRAAAIEDWKVP